MEIKAVELFCYLDDKGNGEQRFSFMEALVARVCWIFRSSVKAWLSMVFMLSYLVLIHRNEKQII